MDNNLPAPNPPATNNTEAYLAMLNGATGMEMPETINNNTEYYLRKLVEKGGGGGGGDGKIYTSGDGIKVDNINDTISVNFATDTEVNTMLTSVFGG